MFVVGADEVRRQAVHVDVFRIVRVGIDLRYTGYAEAGLEREREILQLVAEWHSTKQIGAKLGISAKTVDNHRTNLMRKLNIHDVASLTRHAINQGLLEDKDRS